MEYKVNFIPGLQLKSIQKVHGLIERINGNLHIHLECLDDSEILEFRMELFYKLAKSKMNCLFTGDGISIEGVKLMRKGTEIVLEGDYS